MKTAAQAAGESIEQKVARLERELSATHAKLVTFAAAESVRADENEQDAKRYRWLRDYRLSENYNFSMAMGWKPQSLSREQVDSDIDAALKKQRS